MFGTGWSDAKPRLLPLLLVLFALIGLASVSLSADDRQAVASLAEADKLYAEKSYAGALKGYEGLLQRNAVPADRRDDVQYRVGVSLGKSQQWDRALQTSLEFVKTHRGTVWEPRGLYWLGRLYLAVPHQGYKVVTRGRGDAGTRGPGPNAQRPTPNTVIVYRGNDVPKVAADGKPERVYLGEQDFQNAKDALEAARVDYPAYRAARKTETEEIQLDFDLARVLQNSDELYRWAVGQNWKAPEDPEWTVDPAAAYSPTWAPPKKLAYLYAHALLLSNGEAPNAQRPTPNAHSGALALMGKALWLKNYHQFMRQWAVKYVDYKTVKIPYPYQDLAPVSVLRQLVKQFPDDLVREQAQYTIGTWTEEEAKFTAAVEEYQQLILDRPKSKWVEDARLRLQEINRKQVSLYRYGPADPSKPVTVQLSYRNTPQVHLEAFRVPLETLLEHPAHPDDGSGYTWNQFNALFGSIAEASKRYGPLLAKWDLNTGDKGDHQGGQKEVTVPVKEPGAYVVEASAPGVRAANVVLVTDLVMVQKQSRDEGIFFLTEGNTGTPVPGAEVLARQWWVENGTWHAATTHGRTGSNGLFTAPLQRGPGRNSFRMAAVASKVNGKANRYALTQQLWTPDQADNPDTWKVYSVSDRSVYRPGQTVNYRELVMRRERGDLKPAAGEQVRVAVTNPRGGIVHQEETTCGEFGSVNGRFDLPSDAPLGEYTVHVSLPNHETGPTQFGGNRFRVEEYKKPEFEVSVEPAAERVRLGEKTSAKVHAGYYFGGPVPNAKVTYRVYRSYYVQQYRFPRPFDFLYHYSNTGDYDTNYRNGEVIAQGDAHTDEKGDATVSFSTDAKGSRWQGTDLSFTVEADVQDATRRVISGSGAVKATRHDVGVFLNFAHGYATKGDRVDVEVMTLNPSDQPVSVAGTAKAFRYPDTPDGKEKLVWEQPLKTDAHGRAFIKWTAEQGGHFRVAFVTHDSADEEVVGSTDVWVEGPELEQGRFLFQSVLLQVENLYYEEGQTAKLLLVTPAPGCSVLLTRESNNEVVQKQVLRVKGRSLEIKLPITRADIPNFYVSVVLVRDGQLLQAQQPLYVPSVRQFTAVTVRAEKEQYRPGEKARLHLAAKDWQGRPVHSELSVAVTDASLAYIQKDYAPEIRAYFYGDLRSASVPEIGSPGTQFDGAYEDLQPNGSFKTHEWVLPEGMGQLPDWPGETTDVYWLGNRVDYYFGRQGRYRGDVMNGPMGAPGAPGGFGGGGLVSLGAVTRSEMAAGAIDKEAELGEHRDADRAKKPEGSRRALAKGLEPGEPGSEEPEARANFADTAFWTPAVVTDGKGEATVEVTWPDNLTQWRAAAVGSTSAAQVGSGETRVRTKKDLLIQLEAPRFFVERDQVLLSANVHNYLPADARVKVRLDLTGDTAEMIDGAASPEHRTPNAQRPTPNTEVFVEIPKDGEKRVDWTVQVNHEGSLKVRMSAQSQDASDAMESTFPVLVHGVERALAQSGVLRDGKRAELAIQLPMERKPGSSELVVQLNPSLGAVMLDALPYLADYPYGCIEQTMSRFLPTVVVAKTLKDAGYDLEALGERARKLEEQERKNGPAPATKRENSPYSYPKGRPGSLRTIEFNSEQPTRRWHSPVFDSQSLKNMVLEGLGRIAGFQHGDGGWGWWPGDSSDPYMTSYVLYGLITAKQAGYDVTQAEIEKGLEFLKGRFLEDDNFHRMAYEARVLAMDPHYRDAIKPLATGRLWENRERLSAYSKALLAMALSELGDREKAETMLRNIETTAKIDPENGTANWGEGDGGWWCWWNNKVETNAAVLQAYEMIRPSDEMPSRMVKWLVNNRRGNIWYSTRETAMAVYALADYVRVNKEMSPEYTLTVDLGGKVRREFTVNRENALFFDNQFVVPDELLDTGTQTLSFTKEGPGTLYYSAFTRYFSLEEPIRSTGNEIFVKRRYFRLLPGTASGQPVDQPLDRKRENPFLTGRYELLTEGGEASGWQDPDGGPRYERVALKEGETVTSGDLLEVELQLESKNDYDYLVFEDLKPSGCEPVELRSGSHGGIGLWSNMELRDQKVAFFLTSLPQGTRTLTYRLRAEIPGKFHVLPTNGYAMYAPDIRCLSDESTLAIRDREE